MSRLVLKGAAFVFGWSVATFMPASAANILRFDVAGAENTNALVINDAAWIARDYNDSGTNTYHGFLRAPDGTITTLDPPGSTGTMPLAIKGHRGIRSHGFIRAP